MSARKSIMSADSPPSYLLEEFGVEGDLFHHLSGNAELMPLEQTGQFLAIHQLNRRCPVAPGRLWVTYQKLFLLVTNRSAARYGVSMANHLYYGDNLQVLRENSPQKAAMAFITEEQYILAQTNGHRFDIGCFSKEEASALKKAVKNGHAIKVKALWPYLLSGTVHKTCYIFLINRNKPDLNHD
jgi:hypothetical protein